MKRTVFTLLALLALLPCTQCLAQPTQAAAPPASMAAVSAPDDAAAFLATLAGGQSNTPDLGVLPPAPDFLSTICTSDTDCPAGQKCCYPCGIDGCDFICMVVRKNRCPFFP